MTVAPYARRACGRRPVDGNAVERGEDDCARRRGYAGRYRASVAGSTSKRTGVPAPPPRSRRVAGEASATGAPGTRRRSRARCGRVRPAPGEHARAGAEVARSRAGRSAVAGGGGILDAIEVEVATAAAFEVGIDARISQDRPGKERRGPASGDGGGQEATPQAPPPFHHHGSSPRSRCRAAWRRRGPPPGRAARRMAGRRDRRPALRPRIARRFGAGCPPFRRKIAARSPARSMSREQTRQRPSFPHCSLN